MTDARKGYVLVEGHGEVQAAGNLIHSTEVYPS